jgi:hypothetical protein
MKRPSGQRHPSERVPTRVQIGAPPVWPVARLGKEAEAVAVAVAEGAGTMGGASTRGEGTTVALDSGALGRVTDVVTGVTGAWSGSGSTTFNVALSRLPQPHIDVITPHKTKA